MLPAAASGVAPCSLSLQPFASSPSLPPPCPTPHLTLAAAKTHHSATPPLLFFYHPTTTMPPVPLAPVSASFCALFSPRSDTLHLLRSLCSHYLHNPTQTHPNNNYLCANPSPTPHLQDIREQGHLCSLAQEVHGPDGSVCDCVVDLTTATYLE